MTGAQRETFLRGMFVMLVLLSFGVAWLAVSNARLASQAAGLRSQVSHLEQQRDQSTAELRGQIDDLQRQVSALIEDNQRLAQLVRDLGGNPDGPAAASTAPSPASDAERGATTRTAPPRPAPASSPRPSPTPRPEPKPSPSPCTRIPVLGCVTGGTP